MANTPKPQPSAALAEMLAQDAELDRILDGRGLTFDRTPAPAPKPPTTFHELLAGVRRAASGKARGGEAQTSPPPKRPR